MPMPDLVVYHLNNMGDRDLNDKNDIEVEIERNDIHVNIDKVGKGLNSKRIHQ